MDKIQIKRTKLQNTPRLPNNSYIYIRIYHYLRCKYEKENDKNVSLM